MKESLLCRLRAAKDFAVEMKFDDSRPLTLADATDLCSFLAEQTDIHRLLDTQQHGAYSTPLYHLVMAFQPDTDEQTREQLRDHGLPELLRLCDLALAESDPPDHPLSMMAKMFALYGYEPGIERMAAMARRFPDSFILSVAFRMLGHADHPHGPALIEWLREPLPSGFAAILTLDLANTLCRQQRLESHPFDRPSAYPLLEAWLTDPSEEQFSYALSSAASLPFIDAGVRNQLAALALDHPDPGVQMEAAWASAYHGGEAGLKVLSRMAEDARFSMAAQHYLEELGRTEVIPEGAREPDFWAMAQMCSWLAHPQEFGRPPSDITLYDTRKLYWPPTGDTRQLWLFRYCYAKCKTDGSDDVGIGLVGSVTFALFGEATADLCPEDVYGLHCCWELEGNQDPRTPKKRTAKAGRKLLGI